MDKEIIALLPPEARADGREVSRVLVRFGDGRMALEDVADEPARTARQGARFRRSRPIIDPATREVIGYEMEQVLMPAGA
jgi:hypothetical protein